MPNPDKTIFPSDIYSPKPTGIKSYRLLKYFKDRFSSLKTASLEIISRGSRFNKSLLQDSNDSKKEAISGIKSIFLYLFII
ncbi:hypothetical protein D3C86_1574150 [compost metagenome]